MTTRAQALADFTALVESLGGTLVETTWLGTRKPHWIRCAEGHDTTVIPNSVHNGYGWCQTCRRTPTWDKLRDHVTRAGATLNDTEWLGADTPHSITCKNQHTVLMTPADINRDPTHRVCLLCTVPTRTQKRAVAWERFKQQVAAQGGTVLEPFWCGSETPHRIQCSRGHISQPRPSNLRRGKIGICKTCGAHRLKPLLPDTASGKETAA